MHNNMSLGLTSRKVANGGDPFFSSVVFLSDFEGTDGQSSGNLDDSDSNHTGWVWNGTAQLDDVHSKWGSTSLLLDGNSDYLAIPDSVDWQLGAGDNDPFTVEAWIWPAGGGYQSIVAQWGATSELWMLNFKATQELQLQVALDGTAPVDFIINNTAAPQDIVDGQWNHIALSKTAQEKWQLFVHGIAGVSVTRSSSSALADVAEPLTIGALGVPSSYFVGWIGSLRITKGVCRYDDDFDVPTGAFPRE